MRQSPYLPNRPLKVAVLGSSGAVGSELLKILEQRDFPISELVLLSSERSEGKKIIWKDEELVTKKTTKEEFKNLDLVLASAGGSISKKWLSTIIDQNALLIDNSSAFRLDKNVPLIVPEVNASDVLNHDGGNSESKLHYHFVDISFSSIKQTFDYSKSYCLNISICQWCRPTGDGGTKTFN